MARSIGARSHPTNIGKQSYRLRGAEKYSHSLVLESRARSLR
jgi:hypothetical protein